MSDQATTSQTGTVPVLSTPAARVKWLVQTRHAGNRKAFAGTVGVSHTSINRTVSGTAPGAKLIDAIVRHLGVSREWLVNGEGYPFPEDGEVQQGRQSWVPVSAALLPGPVGDHPDLLSRDWRMECSGFFDAGQYWYRLGNEEPITREVRRGFRRGDLLLLETDRQRFPPERSLDEHLCVVRFREGETPLKLCLVTYHQGGDGDRRGLRASTFESPVGEQDLVREVTYRHHPGGQVTSHEELKRIVETRHGRRAVPVGNLELEPLSAWIVYADVVAVWTTILRRPGDVPLE